MRLSEQQRSVLKQLCVEEYRQLGCIETVAIRMCRPSRSGSRPALVQRSSEGFRLSDAGTEVVFSL